MPDSNVNSQENARTEERGLYMQKETVINQIGELLFREGLINLREKKRFDELMKKS